MAPSNRSNAEIQKDDGCLYPVARLEGFLLGDPRERLLRLGESTVYELAVGRAVR